MYEKELASAEDISGYWEDATPIWKVKGARSDFERRMMSSMVVNQRVILQYYSAVFGVWGVGLYR